MGLENLDVFKKSHALTLDLYKLTAAFPSTEKYGLSSQVRRASSSICANLIEGSHRNSKKEFRQFAGISRGSAGELKYHLLLAKDLNYISESYYQKYIGDLDHISKMLYGLIVSLEKSLVDIKRRAPTTDHRPPTTFTRKRT